MGPQSSLLKNNSSFNLRDVSGRRKGELFAADLKNALDDVEYVANYFRDQEEGGQAEDEWKYVAMVIDTFFLYVFNIFIFLGTIVIFSGRLMELGVEEKCLANNEQNCL